MEVVKLRKENVEEVAEKAAAEILKGNLVIYPSDTIYGIAGNALDKEAVAKVRKAKQMSSSKPISVMFPSFKMLEEYVDIPAEQLQLMKEKGSHYTFIVWKKLKGPQTFTEQGSKIGIRITPTPLTKRMIEKCGVPLTSTSANITGHKGSENVGEAVAEVGEHCALAIDGGESKVKPSSVIDITEPETKVLRKG